MNDNVIIQLEPEEVVETSLRGILSAVLDMRVEGALNPAEKGEVKSFNEETYASVKVDLASQDFDGPTTADMLTLSAVIGIRVAMDDDATGFVFRDQCRKCRAALVSLTGDECERLGGETLAVDGFMVDSTSTDFEDGDSPSKIKTYTATVKCRVLNKEGVG